MRAPHIVIRTAVLSLLLAAASSSSSSATHAPSPRVWCSSPLPTHRCRRASRTRCLRPRRPSSSRPTASNSSGSLATDASAKPASGATEASVAPSDRRTAYAAHFVSKHPPGEYSTS